jgi:hypothetical protein
MAKAWIKAIRFETDMIHIFQILDLCLFGNLKKRQQSILSMYSIFATFGDLTKILHNVLQAGVETNIQSTFLTCRFEFNPNFWPYSLVFRDEKLRESESFQEFWILSLSPDELSKRRQEAAFGWINEQFWNLPDKDVNASD